MLWESFLLYLRERRAKSQRNGGRVSTRRDLHLESLGDASLTVFRAALELLLGNRVSLRAFRWPLGTFREPLLPSVAGPPVLGVIRLRDSSQYTLPISLNGILLSLQVTSVSL